MKLCVLQSPNIPRKVGYEFAIEMSVPDKKGKDKKTTVPLGIIKEIHKSYIVVNVEGYSEIVARRLVEGYPKYFTTSEHPYTTIFI